MPAAAERAREMPRGFSGPVAYDDRWLWLAIAAVALVLGYYLVVLRLTRERPDVGGGAMVTASPGTRSGHLERIDRVAAGVADGTVSARVGHQRLSEIVRSFVGEVSDLPAPTMTLADLRARAARSPALVEAIELMYPPEFAPDDAGRARELFDDAVVRARGLVTSWT